MVSVPNDELPPLQPNEDGVILVGKTRVPLDTVVEAYNEGILPEEIVQQYPSLKLADVYSAIAYYLYYRDEVHRYLEARQEHAAQVRQENEARFDPKGVHKGLLHAVK